MGRRASGAGRALLCGGPVGAVVWVVVAGPRSRATSRRLGCSSLGHHRQCHTQSTRGGLTWGARCASPAVDCRRDKHVHNVFTVCSHTVRAVFIHTACSHEFAVFARCSHGLFGTRQSVSLSKPESAECLVRERRDNLVIGAARQAPAFRPFLFVLLQSLRHVRRVCFLDERLPGGRASDRLRVGTRSVSVGFARQFGGVAPPRGHIDYNARDARATR